MCENGFYWVKWRFVGVGEWVVAMFDGNEEQGLWWVPGAHRELAEDSLIEIDERRVTRDPGGKSATGSGDNPP
jgi:hypothetical protein